MAGNGTADMPGMDMLEVDWDIKLVGLSFVISIFGSFTSLELITAATFTTNRKHQWFLVLLGAFALSGCGIWAMHFVGIMAISIKDVSGEPIELFYSIPITITSLILGYLGASIGFVYLFFKMKNTTEYHRFPRSFRELMEMFSIEKDNSKSSMGSLSTIRVDGALLDIDMQSEGDSDDGGLEVLTCGRSNTDYWLNNTRDLASTMEKHVSFGGEETTPGKKKKSVISNERVKMLNSMFDKYDEMDDNECDENGNFIRKIGGSDEEDEDTLGNVSLRRSRSFRSSVRRFMKHIRNRRTWISACILGSGILAMHWMGVLGTTGTFHQSVNLSLVLFSCVAAVIASAIALSIMKSMHSMLLHLFSALILATAVCAIHYLGQFSCGYYPMTAEEAKEFEANRSALTFRGGAMGMIVAGLTVVVSFLLQGVVSSMTAKKRDELDELVAERTVELREKSKNVQDVLLAILPNSVADRIQNQISTHGTNGIKPIHNDYQQATIVFADLVGFTSLSSTMDSKTLVGMLNDIFSAFDDLAHRMGLEKIKTIGDCYMLASGIPNARADHAEAAVAFAVMMNRILRFLADSKYGLGERLGIRIGVNTGAVTAGVIGKRKFAYDVWGDTVNVASRMESTGLVGRVQISESTYQLIQHRFPATERGEVQVKGKGAMKTYLIDGL